MRHYLWWFMQVAVIAAFCLLLALLVLFLIRRIRRARGKSPSPLSPKTLFLNLLLAGDVLVTVLLTLVARRVSGDAMTQLQLFSSWREAWNAWAPHLFEQLFLNIAVFVPFGALVTLRFPRARRVGGYGALTLAFSLCIELLQLLTRRGVFDVDDLLGNAIGGILGGALVCLIIALTKRRPARALLASLPLLLFAAACGCFFGAYAAQPYGNLSVAPTDTYPMHGTEVYSEISLSDAPGSAPVYRETEFDENACTAAAARILSALGLPLEEAAIDVFPTQITYDYPNEGIYLNYSRTGGTWYLAHLADGTHPAPAIRTEEELATHLADFGLEVQAAEILYAGRQIWRVYPPADRASVGQIVCIFHTDGRWSIDAGIPHLSLTREEPILSPRDVLGQIREGRFRLIGDALFPADSLTLTALTLTYRTDTKGFLQPVWRAAADIDGVSCSLLIPALQ